ncbi:CHC2 zinc finger domain-containing protein [Actinorhabdospora filicis]|uniref:CHC2 zinc finger domain-containing protein n=1 Tax=Actinorhabdospora filicis TaxID=1785913 RepID=UPI003D7F45D6
MTNCPLHTDDTPSFSYDLDREVWKCHSCGEGGDVYTLIMLKENLPFVAARTHATALGLDAGRPGGSHGGLSGSAHAGRRPVPRRQGNHTRDGAFVPRWHRR